MEVKLLLVRVKTVAITLVLFILIACSRSPSVIGVSHPEIPVSSVPNLKTHKIFILSTRSASDKLGELYSSSRAPELLMASVETTVPPTHVTGVLERPKKLPPDPRTEFTIINPSTYEQETSFVQEVNKELAKRSLGNRELLVFIHGFNNTTSEAVLRLSQFVEDTNYKGVPILFTWASAGKGTDYVYDMNSVLIARARITDMARVVNSTRAEGGDVFAHSMGAFLAMEGLVAAQKAGTLGTRTRINHIVLASPDIDMDLFETQVSILPSEIVNKIYLLISNDDTALRTARWLAGSVPRVGAADVLELERFGVTVIDLGQVKDSSSGSHSKFAGSPEVVQLIGDGMNSHSDFGDIGHRTTSIRIFRH